MRRRLKIGNFGTDNKDDRLACPFRHALAQRSTSHRQGPGARGLADDFTDRRTHAAALLHAAIGAEFLMPVNEFARASTPSPGLAAGESGRRAPHSPRLGTGSARVLIRLPDLRAPQKQTRWRQWLGFALAVIGGGSLSAAGTMAASGDHSSPNTPAAGAASDTDRVARWRAIYLWSRPLLNYMLTHPKTIVSGALAAAAQFAALVAWHNSGQPLDNFPDVERTRVVKNVGDPPVWCPDPAFHADHDHHDSTVSRHSHDEGSDRGPQIIDPHVRRSNDRRYRERDRHDRDWENTPHAALNRPSRLNDDGDGRETTAIDDGDDAADPNSQRVALRHSTPPTRPAAGRGVAWLEGNIIPSPPREASHESAQPRVH